jgi:hypothetical protein
MKRSTQCLGIAAGAIAMSAVPASAAIAKATTTGPSSSQSPYVVPVEPGGKTTSILTVGDSAGGYRMTGIPDGLGAFDNGDGTFTLLMNHELGATSGAVHAHGARGAFVSRWTIDKKDLTVTAGEDLIKRVATWNAATGAYDAAALGVALNRLCSASLPELAALFDSASGRGYAGRIFLSGEEAGTEGRAFAHVVSGPEAGTSYELPALGKFSFENVVANPATGTKTVVVGTDDTTPGELYVYAGEKRSSGNAAERAGLVGGVLGGIRVAGYPTEPAAGIPSGTRFDLAGHGDVSAKTGATLQSESTALGVTKFLRPEDAAWDPSDPSKLYFVTTASFDGPSRLWRLNFDDPSKPAQGGTIDMLLEGDEGQHMMDNITVDGRGHVLIQEDPGGNPHLAKVHRYDIGTDTLSTVAQHDPSRFDPAVANPLLTQDEESSGILDVSDILGPGWYLGDVQAHYANPDRDLVEGGQLFALHVPPGRNG